MREEVQNAVREIIQTMPDLVSSAVFGGSAHDVILGPEKGETNEFGQGINEIPEAMRITLLYADPIPFRFDPIELGGKPRIITNVSVDAIKATLEIGVSPILSATICLSGKRRESGATRESAEQLPALVLHGTAFTSGRATVCSRSANEWIIVVRIPDFADHLPIQVGDDVTLMTRMRESVEMKVTSYDPQGYALILTARGA